MSIFEWPFKTGFTVVHLVSLFFQETQADGSKGSTVVGNKAGDRENGPGNTRQQETHHHQSDPAVVTLSGMYHVMPLDKWVGAQWPSGRVLDSRPRGRRFEPHRRHWVVVLKQDIYPSLVLVQPRKTCPCLTKRLLMGRKESNQTNKDKGA